MAEQRRKPVVTETVEDLSGTKVLVVKVDGKIAGVQSAKIVGERLVNVGALIEAIDTNLAKTDAAHLDAAQKRIDERIAVLVARKAALIAEGVTATAKARLQEKRLGLVTQRDALAAAVEGMAG